MTKIFNKLVEMAAEAPLTLAISALALGLFYFPALAQIVELPLAGNGWMNPVSLVGCHLLHWSGGHLFWDLGMFVVTGYLCERGGRWAYLGTLGLAAVAIPPVVIWYHPELSSYRGLSGLDTALFALFISRSGWQAIRTGDQAWLYICIGLWLAMIGKSAFELATGQVLFVDTESFVPVPIAHLIGILCGSAMAALPARNTEPPATVSVKQRLGLV